MGRRHVGRGDAKEIARERIERLFELAEQEASAGKQPNAQRYVSLALKIGQRHKVRTGHKRTYCPGCHSFFIPPKNVRVRISRGKISMTCLSCGNVLRTPMKSEKG